MSATQCLWFDRGIGLKSDLRPELDVHLASSEAEVVAVEYVCNVVGRTQLTGS